MDWFRLYGDMPSDPKIGTLNDGEFRTWIELLCAASKYDQGGDTGLSAETVDWALRRDVTVTLPRLLERDLVTVGDNGNYRIRAWEKRQSADSLRPSSEVWRVIRSRIFERDNYTCQYCGARGVRLECDHIIPVSRGGSSDDKNLTTACFDCNRSKRNKLINEWKGA